MVRYNDFGAKGDQQITEVVSTMDILPTIATLCQTSIPKREIDVRDISKLLLENRNPEHKPFIYYTKIGKLAGIRAGAFKLISDGKEFHLCNIEEDISEEYDVKEKQEERFDEMLKLMHEMDTKITNGSRKVGQLDI